MPLWTVVILWEIYFDNPMMSKEGMKVQSWSWINEVHFVIRTIEMLRKLFPCSFMNFMQVLSVSSMNWLVQSTQLTCWPGPITCVYSWITDPEGNCSWVQISWSNDQVSKYIVNTHMVWIVWYLITRLCINFESC